ncbi:ABC transporter permease [bacterium]|nr:MAG: ABC transporter permease [bacterium]RIK63092.1 MAG: hypothetical protein DCC64_08485 [Planctomycetota bacterium]
MPWSELIRQMLKKRLALLCLAIMALFVLVACTARLWVDEEDLVPRAGETALDETTGLERSYHPPGWLLWMDPGHGHFSKTGQNVQTKEDNPPLPEAQRHWGVTDIRTWHLPLGCDIHGVSVLAKLIRGTELAFLIGLIPTIISSFIAVVIGLVAGYFGKWIDDLVGYVISTLASIPFVLLLIAFVQAVRDSDAVAAALESIGLDSKPYRNLLLVLIVIGMTTWIGLCRLVRAEVIKHKSREYVQAARALGCSHARVLFKHILPNVMHLVIITFTLSFVGSVALEVFLSYVGIGIEPELHTWGRLIVGGRNELQRDPSVWWPLTSATAVLFLLTLSFSLFGDALRDALDPKLRT